MNQHYNFHQTEPRRLRPALEYLEHYQQQQQQQQPPRTTERVLGGEGTETTTETVVTFSNSSRGDGPCTCTAGVDLLAVVVSCRQTSRRPTDANAVEVVEIGIADPSLEAETYGDDPGATMPIKVSIVMYGKNAIQAKSRLTVGDVVRFHRPWIRRKIIKTTTLPVTPVPVPVPVPVPNNLKTAKYHPRKRRTVVELLYELGASVGDNMHTAAPAFTVLNSANANSKHAMFHSGTTATTNPTRVHELGAWHNKNQEATAAQPPELSLIPCQRRSLEEVLGLPGVISHVPVLVLSLEVSTTVHDTSPSKKRRKGVPRNATPRTVHRAMVSDVTEGGTPVLFLHSVPALVPILQMAAVATSIPQQILLHNIVCRAGRDVPSWWKTTTHSNTTELDDELLILATDTTYITTTVHPPLKNCQPPTTTTNPASQTQPLCSADATVDSALQPPPETMSHRHVSDVNSPSSSVIFTLEAPMYRIEFDHKNTTIQVGKGSSAFLSREKSMALLLQPAPGGKVGYEYSQATVCLQHASLRGQKILAHAPALQMLCCGLPATELQGNPSFQRHVVTFLRGLLDDKIVLRWTLCRDTDTECLRVVEVTLLELPEMSDSSTERSIRAAKSAI